MTIRTATQVIKKLGGIEAVCALTGSKYTAVWNWQKANKFPAYTFVLMDSELRRQGIAAPSSLWGMAVAPKRRSEHVQA